MRRRFNCQFCLFYRNLGLEHYHPAGNIAFKGRLLLALEGNLLLVDGVLKFMHGAESFERAGFCSSPPKRMERSWSDRQECELSKEGNCNRFGSSDRCVDTCCSLMCSVNCITRHSNFQIAERSNSVQVSLCHVACAIMLQEESLSPGVHKLISYINLFYSYIRASSLPILWPNLWPNLYVSIKQAALLFEHHRTVPNRGTWDPR